VTLDARERLFAHKKAACRLDAQIDFVELRPRRVDLAVEYLPHVGQLPNLGRIEFRHAG
jgi:hypothetical protein